MWCGGFLPPNSALMKRGLDPLPVRALKIGIWLNATRLAACRSDPRLRKLRYPQPEKPKVVDCRNDIKTHLGCSAASHRNTWVVRKGVRSSDLPDRRKIEIAAGRILANPNCRFVDKFVWRNRQIVRRGDTIEYASCQIIFRAMTRTKISAQPVCRGLRGILKRLEQRNAAEMGAYPDKHSIFRF